MNLSKTRTESIDHVGTQLDDLARSLETLNKTYHSSDKEIFKDIKKTLDMLVSCNNTLQEKEVTMNQKMSEKVQQLLRVIMNLQLLNADRSLQERVNALQTGLFSAYLKQLEKFEKNLRGRGWRIGERVKDTDKSKTT